jgi:hypothetical protein
MATPSPIIPQQALFSFIDMNGEEHHCFSCDKEQDKNVRCRQSANSSLFASRRAKQHFVGSFVSAARSPSVFQATSSLVTASISMSKISDVSVGVEAALNCRLVFAFDILRLWKRQRSTDYPA